MPGLSALIRNGERATQLWARCYMRRTNTKQNTEKNKNCADTFMDMDITWCVCHSRSVSFCFSFLFGVHSVPSCLRLESAYRTNCAPGIQSPGDAIVCVCIYCATNPSEMEPSMGKRVVSFPCYCKTGGVFRYLVYTRYIVLCISNVWFIPRNVICK